MSAWPDVEGALRTYLRNDTGLAALVDRRVFFGVPQDPTRFPLVTIQRIGGGQDPSADVPIDLAVVQVDAWGNPRRKDEAYGVMAAIRTALEAIRGRTQLDTGVTAFGAEVETVLFAPDPADDRPRYSATVLVTAIAA